MKNIERLPTVQRTAGQGSNVTIDSSSFGTMILHRVAPHSTDSITNSLRQMLGAMCRKTQGAFVLSKLASA